jgi:FAD/FMN-containing dehydrogenase
VITLGGMLAIGAHGAVVSTGQAPAGDDGYASLSDQVQSVTAVVWDEGTQAYALRTFERPAPQLAALATNLGRTFLTEVVLRVGPATRLRCRSILDQPASKVFAAPAKAGRHSFAALLNRTGRVESILFPHAENPWTKTWEVAPTKPAASKATTAPYNYTFSDSFPIEVSHVLDHLISGPGPERSIGTDLLGGGDLGALADQVIAGNATLTPVFGQASYLTSRAAVAALGVGDLWGPAFHTQLYIKASTLRFGQIGFVVHCARADVQDVAHRFHQKVLSMTAAYEDDDLFPINGPLEIRCSGLDRADDGSSPLLSALRPHADHPSWDTALWVNLMTFPGTEGSYEFFTELEGWVRSTFVAPHAAVRVEWSKVWAYSAAGPFTNDAMLAGGGIAADYGPAWELARAQLQALDPHRIFTNPFLDRLGI